MSDDGFNPWGVGPEPIGPRDGKSRSDRHDLSLDDLVSALEDQWRLAGAMASDAGGGV